VNENVFANLPENLSAEVSAHHPAAERPGEPGFGGSALDAQAGSQPRHERPVARGVPRPAAYVGGDASITFAAAPAQASVIPDDYAELWKLSFPRERGP